MTYRRIYKYGPLPIGKLTKIIMPPKAEVVHFAQQNGDLFCWAIVEQAGKYAFEDPNIERLINTRKFFVLGTGHDIPPLCDYISTCLTDAFVWHLFEVK